MSDPTPEKVMQVIKGSWETSILGTEARHGLFTALEGSPDTAEGVAKKTDLVAWRSGSARRSDRSGTADAVGWQVPEHGGGVGLPRQGQARLSRRVCRGGPRRLRDVAEVAGGGQ